MSTAGTDRGGGHCGCADFWRWHVLFARPLQPCAQTHTKLQPLRTEGQRVGGTDTGSNASNNGSTTKSMHNHERARTRAYAHTGLFSAARGSDGHRGDQGPARRQGRSQRPERASPRPPPTSATRGVSETVTVESAGESGGGGAEGGRGLRLVAGPFSGIPRLKRRRRFTSLARDRIRNMARALGCRSLTARAPRRRYRGRRRDSAPTVPARSRRRR